MQKTVVASLKKSGVACYNCHRSKIKCAGSPPHRCIACKVKDRKCEYPRADKKCYVSERYLKGLQSRVKALEAIAASLESQGSSRRSETDPHNDDDNDNDDDQDLQYYEGETLFHTKSGEQYFVGIASSTHLATQLDPSSEPAAWDFSPFYASLPGKQPNPIIIELPPFDTALEWYRMKYAYIGTIFSFVQPRDFEARLRQVYNDPMPESPSMEDCLVYCQVLICLSFGQMYSINSWTGNEGPPGFGYFKDALHFLPEIYEDASVLFVETLALVGYYFGVLNRRDAAFNYIGIALRMAISLGLHREVSSPDIEDAVKERRRRVWWSVFSMDRVLCVKSGNPTTIHDEDIDVGEPSYLPEIDDSPSPARVLSHYTKLSQILGKIGDRIYRKHRKTGTNLINSVQDIMKDLSVWLREIPEELRLDFENLETKSVSREAVSTWLHYSKCMNMTARPLLFYICQKQLEALDQGLATSNWKTNLAKSVVVVIEKTIATARTSTFVINNALKQNLFATFGFMDGEHAFSEALTLVMANMAFPYDERLEATMALALSVLQRMAAKGNQYIKARHALLNNFLNSRKRSTSTTTSDADALAYPAAQMTVLALRHPDGTDQQPQAQAQPPNIGSFIDPGQTFEPRFDFLEAQMEPFDLSVDVDLDFWDDMSKNVDIDMDEEFMKSFLR